VRGGGTRLFLRTEELINEQINLPRLRGGQQSLRYEAAALDMLMAKSRAEWLETAARATSPSMRNANAPDLATRPATGPSAEMSAPVTGESILSRATHSRVNGSFGSARGKR